MSKDARGIGMTSARTRARLLQRLREQGISDIRVLSAMNEVPRHLFVEEALASRAYEDTALPIGQGQTISQPWVVALMTQALIEGHVPRKVLEVGTGCGYQSAVLAQLVPEVLTVERIEALHRSARLRLRKLGYQNIRFKLADEEWGWPEQGPFDGILVTAAGTEVPASLLAQLAIGGIMIIPIGPPGQQDLIKYTRLKDTFDCVRLTGVSFVPLIRGGA